MNSIGLKIIQDLAIPEGVNFSSINWRRLSKKASMKRSIALWQIRKLGSLLFWEKIILTGLAYHGNAVFKLCSWSAKIISRFSADLTNTIGFSD
jgi:hypothetical protein